MAPEGVTYAASPSMGTLDETRSRIRGDRPFRDFNRGRWPQPYDVVAAQELMTWK
jgi:hypothetical protein